MTAILVVAIIVLLVGAISGATMSAIGKERKSIESHKKVLSVMEDLASSTTENRTQTKSKDPEGARIHVRAVRPIGQRTNGSAKAVFTQSDDPLTVAAKSRGRIIGLHGDRFFVEEGDENPKTLQIPIVNLKETDEHVHQFSELESNDLAEDPKDESRVSNKTVIEDYPEPEPELDDRQQRAVPLHVSHAPQMKIGSVVMAVGVGVIGVSALVFKVATTSYSSKNFASTSLSPKKSSSSSSKKNSTTTTTAPLQITPTASNAAGATYNVSGGTLTIQLTASAPCWVEQSNVPYGKLYFAQTLAAGQSQILTTSAPVWIRTGNVGALSVKINNVPVVISAPPGAYNLSFNAG